MTIIPSDSKMTPVKAVLFDLDDTLLDHQHSNRIGLATAQQKYQCLREKRLEELERENLNLLNDLHDKFLRGIYSLDEARVERFRKLFALCDEEVTHAVATTAFKCFRQAYLAARRPVCGVIPLLNRLKPDVKIAVVTNNLVAEQQDKLRACRLEQLVDALVVSEEAGFVKPDPAIFEIALNRLQCRAEEAVMIGDLWDVDILGAYRAGIRAIWLNRYGATCPDANIATEINSFEPVEMVLDLVLKGRRANPSTAI